jgi:Bacterial type II and III secretion system protein
MQSIEPFNKFPKETSMKKTVLALLLAILVFPGQRLWSQEKGKSEEVGKPAETGKTVTPLRVQVLFTEFDGEKKISSLPYTLPVNAETPLRGQKAALRMGLRVPIMTGASTTGSGGPSQIQYLDVGTNLDGWASKSEDGRFNLHLNLERSSTYSSGTGQKTSPVGVYEVTSLQPVIQTFRAEVDLLIRDGQTMQSTVATDPISGRVTKVDVTVNVIK